MEYVDPYGAEIKRYTLAEVKQMAMTGTMPKDIKAMVDWHNTMYKQVDLASFMQGAASTMIIVCEKLKIPIVSVSDNVKGRWAHDIVSEEHIPGHVLWATLELMIERMSGGKIK